MQANNFLHLRLGQLFKLIVSILVSLSAGAIGSVVTAPAIPAWYDGLAKPALNPPSWVFGPVWTTLYILTGISAFLVWSSYDDASKEKKKKIKFALALFGVQLFLNALWSIIFFGLQSPGWALIEIVFLWIAILFTMIVFYKLSKIAAYLLVPYIFWVSFAAYLNYEIYMLNMVILH